MVAASQNLTSSTIFFEAFKFWDCADHQADHDAKQHGDQVLDGNHIEQIRERVFD